MNVVMISGLSGSGKNTALQALQEADFFIMDNLVPDLWMVMHEQARGHGLTKYAFTVDARMYVFFDDLAAKLDEFLKASRARVLYLEASEEVLLQRYNLTRRKHPLGEKSLDMDFTRERELLAPLRERSEMVLDTTEFTPKQLGQKIEELFGLESKFATRVFSFGFKHSPPKDADLVLDVRGLPNPFYDLKLRYKTGLDPEVKNYVFTPEAKAYYQTLLAFIKTTLQGAKSAGRRSYTVAVGCTGGHHRSVAVVESLIGDLQEFGAVLRDHRDIAKGEY